MDDRFHRILEAGLDGTYLNNRHLFIERNSYKKDSLPPSVFLYYQNAVRPECVYWMRWRDTTTVKDATQQKKSLERANDVFSVHDTVKLIPAKWISGQYFTLKYPFHYGTTIVSKQPVLYQREWARYGRHGRYGAGRRCAVCIDQRRQQILRRLVHCF